MKCPLCSVELVAEEKPLRMHAAWHILNSPELLGDYPCGICAVGSHQQFNSDPASVDGCVAYVEDTTVTPARLVWQTSSPKLKPRIFCQTYGIELTYGVAATQKESKRSPCTNTLHMCPSCAPGPVPRYLWKYNGFLKHWDSRHATDPNESGSGLDDTLKKLVTISVVERAAIEKSNSHASHISLTTAKASSVAAAGTIDQASALALGWCVLSNSCCCEQVSPQPLLH